MSDPNTTTSGLAKPSKSAGLSFYNRFACGAAALLALATAMILVSTSQASQSARDTRDEAHTTLQQAGEELAPYWCSQITPENVKKFDDLRTELVTMDDEIQSAVKEQCYKKTVINDLVANNTPNEAFDTTSECVIGESDSTLACTATVTANDSVKKELAAFPSTTVTLTMKIHTTSSWITSKGYDVGEVGTITIDSSGTGTTQFEIPYDPTWGRYYEIKLKRFYPNE
mgnify:CR=1 FL=1